VKPIFKRLQVLEEKVANHELGGPSGIDILRERRRRRAEANGVPYVEPPRDPKLNENGRSLGWAEILRNARTRRCAEAQARNAEEAAESNAS
jgi:hypothetical protein